MNLDSDHAFRAEVAQLAQHLRPAPAQHALAWWQHTSLSMVVSRQAVLLSWDLLMTYRGAAVPGFSEGQDHDTIASAVYMVRWCSPVHII